MQDSDSEGHTWVKSMAMAMTDDKAGGSAICQDIRRNSANKVLVLRKEFSALESCQTIIEVTTTCEATRGRQHSFVRRDIGNAHLPALMMEAGMAQE